jgi:hypothetical protein
MTESDDYLAQMPEFEEHPHDAAWDNLVNASRQHQLSGHIVPSVENGTEWLGEAYVESKEGPQAPTLDKHSSPAAKELFKRYSKERDMRQEWGLPADPRTASAQLVKDVAEKHSASSYETSRALGLWGDRLSPTEYNEVVERGIKERYVPRHAKPAGEVALVSEQANALAGVASLIQSAQAQRAAAAEQNKPRLSDVSSVAARPAASVAAINGVRHSEGQRAPVGGDEPRVTKQLPVIIHAGRVVSTPYGQRIAPPPQRYTPDGNAATPEVAAPKSEEEDKKPQAEDLSFRAGIGGLNFEDEQPESGRSTRRSARVQRVRAIIGGVLTASLIGTLGGTLAFDNPFSHDHDKRTTVPATAPDRAGKAVRDGMQKFAQAVFGQQSTSAR